MSEESVSIHAAALENMEYSVKTSFGISEASYSGTKQEPLFGTGQGSGASPAAWLSLVVLLMNTIDRVIKQRVRFSLPDSNMGHTRLIDAFVDDTSLSYTNEGTQTYEEMIATLEQVAGKWERLLFYSGGSLNLTKCAWHITFWEWKFGCLSLRAHQTDDCERQALEKRVTTHHAQSSCNPISKRRGFWE